MNTQLKILAILIVLSISLPSFGDSHLAADRDWSQAAQSARTAHVPILILYTAQACGYCERLKREVFQPLLAQETDQPPAVIREVDINAGGKMIDFDGEPIRSRRFTQRYQIFATPTLLILDSRGEPLTDPIIGYDSKEQYQSRIEKLLAGFPI